MIGLSQLSATGVSLVSLSASTSTSGAAFLAAGSACLPIAAAIAAPSVLSAWLMTRVASRMSGDLLALAFNGLSVVLLPTHLAVQYLAAGREAAGFARGDSSHAQLTPDAAAVARYAAFGLFAGALSALMGVGGLPLTMSYLTLATDLPHHLVQGTAVCSAAPAVLASAASRISAVPLSTAGAVTAG